MKGIAAGAGFSLALSGEGDLFGWGNNKDVSVHWAVTVIVSAELISMNVVQGQLGVGDTKDRLIPFVIAAFHADPKHSRVVMVCFVCFLGVRSLILLLH